MGKQVPFDYSAETTPALAASERRTLTIRTQADSYFVVTALAGLSTLAGGAAGDCNVLIGDDTIGAIWCNDAANGVRLNNILGTAQRPAWLTEKVVLNPNTTLTVTLTNLSAILANTVQVVFKGYKCLDTSEEPLPEQKTGAGGRRKRWFQYVSNRTLLASNRDTNQIRIQADSFFMAQQIASVQTGIWRGRLEDSGSGRRWQDNLIRNANLAGTATFPTWFRPPYTVNPAATLQVEFEDLSVAGNTIQVVLNGYKQFLAA